MAMTSLGWVEGERATDQRLECNLELRSQALDRLAEHTPPKIGVTEHEEDVFNEEEED